MTELPSGGFAQQMRLEGSGLGVRKKYLLDIVLVERVLIRLDGYALLRFGSLTLAGQVFGEVIPQD